MKNAMRWIKANPISVASMVIIVVALVFSFMFTAKGRSTFMADVANKSRTSSNSLSGYEKHPVPMPAEKAGDEPEIKNIAVTKSDVDIVRASRQGIAGEANKVNKLLLDRNRVGHRILLKNLFPAPPPGDTTTAHKAKESYKNAILNMFGRFDPAVDTMDLDTHNFAAKLNAGGPADLVAIAEEVSQKAADRFSQNLGALGTGRPSRDTGKQSEEEQADLEREQREHILQAMQKHATRYHIYTSMFEDPTLKNIPGDFAFDVGKWAVESEEPTIDDIWEGQMNLWIQQDLVRAISLANAVDQGQKTSVLTSPVKHLLRIDVDKSYIGLFTPVAEGSARGRRDSGPMLMDYDMEFEGMYMGGGPGGMELEEEEEIDPETTMLPSKFEHSASGRYSNPLYDVRRATLTVVVDSRRIHELLQAINDVNLMTVLEVHITDVDEYTAMQEGFFYGEGDLVEATLEIESVWLREWTQAMMPKETRVNLKIDKEESEEDEDEDDE